MAAATVDITGAGATAKVRDPAASGLLDLVTLGVYGCFWWYYVNRELAALGRAHDTPELGDDARKSVLALVVGFVLVVPAIVTMRNTTRRVIAAQRLAGYAESETLGSVLPFVLLLLLPPIGIWYVQRALNGVWARTSA